jgi:hypothetical protein
MKELTTPKQPLLTDDLGMVEFTVQVEVSDYSMNCVVYKATGWTMGNEIIEDEKYLSAYIKWDGCSHFWFGDEDKYQHLCGKTAVDNHCKVLQAVWELAEKSIREFDKEVAE